MINKTLYILPNQLFEAKHFPTGINKIIVWEHPNFFTKYNFNKKKLILHRASMKYYFDNIKRSLPNITHKYINHHKPHTPSGNYTFFDPINIISHFEDTDKMIESPNFFLTKEDYENIKENKKSNSISFTRYFYPRCKNIIDFLKNQKSTDHDNRKGYNKTLHNMLANKEDDTLGISEEESKYIKEAIKYVNKHFPDHYGNTDNFSYPVSRPNAMKWMKDFIQNRLKHFGTYQDTFNTDHDNMFHSVLSSSINIGLLNPDDILLELRKIQSSIPMNSLEGYLRQLCWREYQRYVYIYYNDVLEKGNFFNLKNKVNIKWYNGTTPMLPVNNCIKKAFDTAYLHHIERLMIIGNYMLLSEVNPQEGHRWFMEFAIDSYEWVMVQNVYDMVFFNGNGLTSYKPYISTTNYLLEMSNYSSDDEWDEKWNSLYITFLTNHYDELYKYRYHFKMLKDIKNDDDDTC